MNVGRRASDSIALDSIYGLQNSMSVLVTDHERGKTQHARREQGRAGTSAHFYGPHEN